MGGTCAPTSLGFSVGWEEGQFFGALLTSVIPENLPKTEKAHSIEVDHAYCFEYTYFLPAIIFLAP